MNWLIPIGKTLTLLAAIGAFAFVADVQAKGKPIRGGCDRGDILCPDVYDPVTCDNGITYPNGCYAYVACATGCSGGIDS